MIIIVYRKNVKNCPEVARGPGRHQRANQSCRVVTLRYNAAVRPQCVGKGIVSPSPHRSLKKFGGPNLSGIQLLIDLVDHASPK